MLLPTRIPSPFQLTTPHRLPHRCHPQAHQVRLTLLPPPLMSPLPTERSSPLSLPGALLTLDPTTLPPHLSHSTHHLSAPLPALLLPQEMRWRRTRGMRRRERRKRGRNSQIPLCAPPLPPSALRLPSALPNNHPLSLTHSTPLQELQPRLSR